MGLGGISNRATAVVQTVLSATIVVILAGSLAAVWFGAIGDANEAIGSTPVNSTVVDELLTTGVFQLIIAILGVMAFVGLITGAMALTRGR
jgi:FlaG/FlaF family flagellin (archaellin)